MNCERGYDTQLGIARQVVSWIGRESLLEQGAKDGLSHRVNLAVDDGAGKCFAGGLHEAEG